MRARGLLLGVAVGAAVVCWWILAGDGAASASGHPPSTAGAPSGVPPDAPAERSRRKEADGGTLTLRATSPEGDVTGTLTWVTGPDPTELLWELAGGSRPRAVEFAHRAEIEVPGGHWTWLRVDTRTPPGLTAHLRVPPFDGRAEQEIVLERDSRTVHVLLLGPDYRTPAAGRSVRVYRTPLPQGGLELAAEGLTDDRGFATFRGLEPGAFLACAPGAAPAEPAPATARVLMPPGFVPQDLTVTLVAPPERLTVHLEVHATFRRAPGVLPPKLFLRRVDDGSGATWPQQGVLRPGAQDLEFVVPEGTYEVSVLPLGVLTIDENGRRLDATPGLRHRVYAEDNPARTLLELQGLGLQEFPVTVYPQPTDGLRDDRPERMFLGVQHWHLSAVPVPSLPEPCRIQAVGRNGSWISQDTVVVQGEKVTVPMQRACALAVRWYDWDPARDAGSTLLVRVGGEDFARYLSPGLVHRGTLARPALVGHLVVPRGQALLTCYRPDGSQAWTRSVAADRGHREVEIGR